jgi:hypothetical protein
MSPVNERSLVSSATYPRFRVTPPRSGSLCAIIVEAMVGPNPKLSTPCNLNGLKRTEAALAANLSLIGGAGEAHDSSGAPRVIFHGFVPKEMRYSLGASGALSRIVPPKERATWRSIP